MERGNIMKIVERWIVKIIVIQFIMLIMTQILFFQLQVLPPQLLKITMYEGIDKADHEGMIKTTTQK